MEKLVDVVIVGAGPAGLATSACLKSYSISNVVLEKEDCSASLWKKRSYDRLKLHLAKQYCQLPYMPIPAEAPVFVPRNAFIQYLDSYVTRFQLNPHYYRTVESAVFDEGIQKWRVIVQNTVENVTEIYVGKFLVVASGENSTGFIPDVVGLDEFSGEVMHSSEYQNGASFCDKDVLVVGCGNSGMEIAYDLAISGARTSIVARNPVHLLTKEIVYLGMFLLRILPVKIVDKICCSIGKLTHGNLTKYGLLRPRPGPFYLKATTNRSPTIDVGCIDKIKRGEVQVLTGITSIQKNKIKFEGGKVGHFDAIIFATGYKNTVRNWLKNGEDVFDEKGKLQRRYPNHWQGENGVYCAGFSNRGLFGISEDAQNIAKNIDFIFKKKGERGNLAGII
ncbi:Flavin-containing monooxygenase [Quillaja saponaria]|uniref:Flavin-containing monooxygenase n=1 Tax=Quillaja saponaria TaxID=32244 RepID=A0AAD7LJC9_QUISA|nr:Flavin-containing monooxygenase [Quillaja saponaria]